jgi:hypothetical protein
MSSSKYVMAGKPGGVGPGSMFARAHLGTVPFASDFKQPSQTRM